MYKVINAVISHYCNYLPSYSSRGEVVDEVYGGEDVGRVGVYYHVYKNR